MKENKNKFETNAIRTQLKRTENLEHSVPLYLTSSFVFEDAEDMRASFAEEKERNIYVIHNWCFQAEEPEIHYIFLVHCN